MQNERQQSIIQSQKLQQLLASPLSTQRGISLVRKLIENKSIAQLSAQDYLSLVEGCRTIDPDFLLVEVAKPSASSTRYCVMRIDPNV